MKLTLLAFLILASSSSFAQTTSSQCRSTAIQKWNNGLTKICVSEQIAINDSKIKLKGITTQAGEGFNLKFDRFNAELVCKAFGFQTVLEISYKKSYFYSDLLGSDVSAQYRLKVLDEVTCQGNANSANISAITAKKIINNADGSVSLEKPYLVMNGEIVTISASSNDEGICKLYGFSTAQDKSIIGPSSTKDTAAIKSDGTFGSLRFAKGCPEVSGLGPNIEKLLGRCGNSIKKITCI